MSHSVKPSYVPPPNLTRDQLLDHLIRVDRNAIKLLGIQNGKAIFRGSINPPITQKTRVRYMVIASVPLYDHIFQTDKMVDYVYPSQVSNWIEFKFDSYTDNSGIGRSWIE